MNTTDKYKSLIEAAKTADFTVKHRTFGDGCELLDMENGGQLVYIRINPGGPDQVRYYDRHAGTDTRISVAAALRWFHWSA